MFARPISKSVQSTRFCNRTDRGNPMLPIYSCLFSSKLQHLQSSPGTKNSIIPPKDPYPLNLTSRNPQFPPNLSSKPIDITESSRKLFPLMLAQHSHYIIIHIYGKPFLVTAGDLVRLPFKIPGVTPGNILRLNRATCIGSRDYTLKGMPYLDERLYECRATVIGTESEPMRYKNKTKRRCRKVKTVKSKHRFTILRIAELKLKGMENNET